MATRRFAAIVVAAVALAGAAAPAEAQSSLCSVQWPDKPGTFYAAVCGIGPLPVPVKHHRHHHRHHNHRSYYGKLVAR